jgi:hypothetical protein
LALHAFDEVRGIEGKQTEFEALRCSLDRRHAVRIGRAS